MRRLVKSITAIVLSAGIGVAAWTSPASAAPGDPGYAAATAAEATFDVTIGGVPSAAATATLATVAVDSGDPPASAGTPVSADADLGVTGIATLAGDAVTSEASSDATGSAASSSIVNAALSLPLAPAFLTSIGTISASATCPVGGAPSATTALPASLTIAGTAVDVTAGGAISTTVDLGGVTVDVTGVLRATVTTGASASAAAVVLAFSLTAPVVPVVELSGTLTLAEATCFTPLAVAPTALSLTPDSGPGAGGTTVTVTGNGFVPGATTVTIGGVVVPADAVTVASPTSLSFATPPHGAGPVEVTVTTPGGTTAPLAYTYLAPAAPVLSAPANGTRTTDPAPVISGGAAGPGNVVVTEGTTVLCTTTAGPDGSFACRPDAPLAVGPHTVTATQTDAGGNTSPASNALSFVVAPAPPTISTPEAGSTRTTATPPIAGTGIPGYTVTVTENGRILCTAVVDAAGVYRCTPTALAGGSHTVTAVQTAPNGTASDPSAAVTFTVSLVVLANTGAPTATVGWTALALLIAGTALCFVARRSTAG